MPSTFEPSGLVREEFFASGTPLVCSNTGGLADQVTPYSEEARAGNSLVTDDHSHTALLEQLRRALQLQRQPEHYDALRRDAYGAAFDVAATAWHWESELIRLRACLATGRRDLERDTEWGLCGVCRAASPGALAP